MENKVGKYVYIYDCISFRGENKKVRSIRRVVGKTDPISGARIFKQSYIDEKRKENIIINNPTNIKLYSIDDLNECEMKNLTFLRF
ncbi:MAG: hypothetical protein LBF68_04855 [Christensenellaceae bacterium]|jgi:hypothetical protein|nr:hypothetical protein [Christensenellaceae bacterium]